MNSAINTITTITFIANVRKPTKAMIDFKKTIIKARIAKMLPPIPAALIQTGII